MTTNPYNTPVTLNPYNTPPITNQHIQFLLKTNPNEFIGNFYTIKEFYNKSIDYANSNNLNTNFTLQKFSKDIKKIIPEYYFRNKDKRGYQFQNANKKYLVKVLKNYDNNYTFN